MRSLAMWLAALALMVFHAGPVKAQTVSCSSDGSKKYCAADTKQGVQLSMRKSDAPCKQGESWGYDEQGIWVDHGCAGDFTLGAAVPKGAKVVACASDGGRKYCDTSTSGGVRLIKQKSAAACKRDSTWGYDGLGIWVDQGCSADFAIGGAAPAQTDAGSDGADVDKKAKDKTCLQTAGKARAGQLVKECLKVSPATHPPCNVQNSCELMTDEIRRSCALLGIEAPSFCNGYK
jgi:Protein of unknown function (DUF3011)